LGAQRDNLYFLLNNIIDPSAQVAENYRLSIVQLDSGRMVSGIILHRTAHTLDVQTATEVLKINREDVEDMQASDLSIMPEQIFNTLTDEQVRDLIAYLQSSRQVPLPGAVTH